MEQPAPKAEWRPEIGKSRGSPGSRRSTQEAQYPTKGNPAREDGWNLETIQENFQNQGLGFQDQKDALNHAQANGGKTDPKFRTLGMERSQELPEKTPDTKRQRLGSHLTSQQRRCRENAATCPNPGGEALPVWTLPEGATR